MTLEWGGETIITAPVETHLGTIEVHRLDVGIR